MMCIVMACMHNTAFHATVVSYWYTHTSIARVFVYVCCTTLLKFIYTLKQLILVVVETRNAILPQEIGA
jgi:hypothetical protein